MRKIVIIGLGAVVLANILLWMYLRQQWRETDNALGELRAAYTQVVSDYEILKQRLARRDSDAVVSSNPSFIRVVLKGTAADPNAQATVYYDPQTHDGFVNATQLKPVSPDKQFQVWAIVRGKMVPVGLFDTPGDGLQPLTPVDDASAFAITVEPRGGRDQPTLQNLQAIGTVFIIPS